MRWTTEHNKVLVKTAFGHFIYNTTQLSKYKSQQQENALFSVLFYHLEWGCAHSWVLIKLYVCFKTLLFYCHLRLFKHVIFNTSDITQTNIHSERPTFFRGFWKEHRKQTADMPCVK